MATKRLRIFAGPNGSGKSTIFSVVDGKIGCPYFVNADEIHHALSTNGKLSFDQYTVIIAEDHFKSNFRESGFFAKSKSAEQLIEQVQIKDNELVVADPSLVDSYFSAFVADLLRINMLNIVLEFSIETVLSDSRKLDYIRLAKEFGYKIYLYFVSTKDVSINIKRVAQRQKLGGHSVPEDKIVKRYTKSLENAFDVLKLCDRAYFFDNSDEGYVKLAEYDAGILSTNQQFVPGWFNEYIIEKMPYQYPHE